MNGPCDFFPFFSCLQRDLLQYVVINCMMHLNICLLFLIISCLFQQMHLLDFVVLVDSCHTVLFCTKEELAAMMFLPKHHTMLCGTGGAAPSAQHLHVA